MSEFKKLPKFIDLSVARIAADMLTSHQMVPKGNERFSPIGISIMGTGAKLLPLEISLTREFSAVKARTDSPAATVNRNQWGLGLELFKITNHDVLPVLVALMVWCYDNDSSVGTKESDEAEVEIVETYGLKDAMIRQIREAIRNLKAAGFEDPTVFADLDKELKKYTQTA